MGHERRLVAGLLVFICGCAGVIPEPSAATIAAQPDIQTRVNECNFPRNRKRAWGAVSIGGGFVAGTSGVATLATIDKDNKTAAYVTTGIAVGAGLAAAVGGFVQKSYDDDFQLLNCSETYKKAYGSPNP